VSKTEQYCFRRYDKIGAADALDDQATLRECFVDTGALNALRECNDPRRIVVGNTGSGKTALLLRLADVEERVINVPPESLALAYITNSNILNFVAGLGAKLDIFFKLLWRHVFAMEILKSHFNIVDERAKDSFIDRIKQLFRDDRHQRALKYLEQWGPCFWEETDYRIKEVTKTLETEVEGSIKGTLGGIAVGVDASRTLTEEQKGEVVRRTQEVVNRVQIRELSDILSLMDAVLDDPQKRYYITVDRLDENWIEDGFRCCLIRALIETVRDFKLVRHAKIAIALRRDLLDRVFRMTRDAGFQEEKYESLYLEAGWTDRTLVEVLDSRVSHLVRRQYTGAGATHRDLMPACVHGEAITDFILKRTLLRPRDVIQFFNLCIEQAVDAPLVSGEMVKTAEGEYSRGRLRALADEWSVDYPNLMSFIGLLKNRPGTFRLSEITDDECGDACLAVCCSQSKEDVLLSVAQQLVEGLSTAAAFRQSIAEVFYRIGLIGLKLESYEGMTWVLNGRRSVSTAEIREDARVSVHPAFWRTLGVGGEVHEWVPDPSHRYEGLEIRAPFLVAFRKVYTALLEDVVHAFSLEPGSPERKEEPTIPESVVREVLVNALTHRSYRVPGTIQVIRFKDRIEVRNPGHSLVEEDQLGQPGSLSRNPRIADVFREMRLAENKGTGIAAMRRAMKVAGLHAADLRV
jgi:hypothetical protein